MISGSPDCLVKLKAQYNNLNPATKRVADHILTNPLDVIENNIVDLAAKIKVSQFSIISCIKSTGYNGYKDFKISLARDFDPSTTTLFEGIAEVDDAYAILCKVAQKKMQSLKDTMHLIDREALNKSIEIITKADGIEIYGIGYSSFAAEKLSIDLKRLGKKTVMYSDPNYQMMSASILTPKDVAFGFSTSGSSISVVKSLELAKTNGAKTIAVTAFADSPLSRFSDIVLLTTYSDPLLLKYTNNSVVEQTMLVSAITLAVAHTDAPHALLNLSETSAVIKLGKDRPRQKGDA